LARPQLHGVRLCLERTCQPGSKLRESQDTPCRTHTRVPRARVCMCVYACGHSLFTCCYVREKESNRGRVVQQVSGAKSVKLSLPARRRRARLIRSIRRRVLNVARNVGALHLARLHRRRHLPASSPGATRRPFADSRFPASFGSVRVRRDVAATRFTDQLSHPHMRAALRNTSTSPYLLPIGAFINGRFYQFKSDKTANLLAASDCM